MQESPEEEAQADRAMYPPESQAGDPQELGDRTTQPSAAASADPPPAAPAWMNDPTRLAEFAERLAACGTRAFRHPSGLALTFEGGRKAPAGDSRW